MDTQRELAGRLILQGHLTAENALDEALRLTDADCFALNQPTLSTFAAYKNVKYDLLTLQYNLLTYLYKTYGILAKVCDVPVDDAYRYGGFDISAETINDDELKELKNKLARSNDIEQLKQARKWARLFGGAALICVEDGKSLDTELDFAKLKNSDIKFMPVERWRLNYTEGNIMTPGGEWYLCNYQMISNDMQMKIHPSRIKLVKGKEAPFLIQQQTQFWGMSVLEQIFMDMNQFFKSRNVIFELMDEAKTDVIKLKALQTALSSKQGERALQKMVDFIARNKNYKSQLTLSTEDDYDQKQVSMTGMEGMSREIRIMMAGSANMPVNKLWGEGVTGFGSGEDSLENYNGLIESEIRAVDLDTIYWILKVRCCQLFGREIEDLFIDWKELRVLSSIDEQNIHDHKIENILKLFDRQLLTPQEVMEILKNQELLIHDTKAIRGELDDEILINQVKGDYDYNSSQRLQKS